MDRHPAHVIEAKSGIHSIRPFKLFTLLDEDITKRTAHVTIPSRRHTGGLMLLETFCVIAAARIVKAHTVFEFGTLLGSTTLNLALNLPDDGRIFTFDLDEKSASNLVQHPLDAPLTQRHLADRPDFEGTAAESRIKIVKGNSLTFDFSPWASQSDLVFIDGGHDLTTVTADTTNARRMTDRTPSCILWHDYRNRDYPELTSYLDGLSAEMDIFHIEDTMLCVSFKGIESGSLLA